jgi:hypothetical protein
MKTTIKCSGVLSKPGVNITRRFHANGVTLTHVWSVGVLVCAQNLANDLWHWLCTLASVMKPGMVLFSLTALTATNVSVAQFRQSRF